MDLRFLGVAISSVHRLSEQVWVNSFRLWFPLGNLSSLRLRARCFYLLVVFPCPLWCSASQCLLPLISSLRAYPRPQDNLPPHPQILSRFSLCVRVIFGFFVAFACGQKNLYKANEGDEIYWIQVTPTLLKAIRPFSQPLEIIRTALSKGINNKIKNNVNVWLLRISFGKLLNNSSGETVNLLNGTGKPINMWSSKVRLNIDRCFSKINVNYDAIKY